ncbi:MAG: tetratricopeptide repeat protein [Planctomycetota bacterium]
MPSAPPDRQFLQALAAHRRGDKQQARALLEALLAQQPDHADALEVLGMLISEAGDLDAAIGLTERVLALRPDSIMAHANLSRFHMLKGDKTTAEEWQAKARVLGWKDEIKRKGEATGAAGGLERGPDAETVMAQEENVVQHPDDVRGRLQLAGSYRKLGMPAKALAHLKHALVLDPRMSILYLELGRTLEEVGAPAEAADIYRRGIPLAEERGDFMPRNQMQSRLAALDKQARRG